MLLIFTNILHHRHNRLIFRLEINFKADIQSTLKRTKILAQSDLSDFIYEPGNLFQGGC